MVRHTLKILQQMLQDFSSISDQFQSSCIKELNQSLFVFISLLRAILQYLDGIHLLENSWWIWEREKKVILVIQKE